MVTADFVDLKNYSDLILKKLVNEYQSDVVTISWKIDGNDTWYTFSIQSIQDELDRREKERYPEPTKTEVKTDHTEYHVPSVPATLPPHCGDTLRVVKPEGTPLSEGTKTTIPYVPCESAKAAKDNSCYALDELLSEKALAILNKQGYVCFKLAADAGHNQPGWISRKTVTKTYIENEAIIINNQTF